MHILTDLITREAALLAMLWILGSGPATFLGRRFDGVSRFVLAPVFGLCIGVVATTTLIEYEPVTSTWWVVIPLGLVSLAIAVVRVIRSQVVWLPRPRHVLQLAVVTVAVLAPAMITLHQAATVGPVSLNVYDAAGYVTEMDGQQVKGIQQATAPGVTTHQNLAQDFWSGYASGFQNMDATPLEASFDDLLGLKASDTQSAFMIVVLLAAALGAFAAYRYLLDSDSGAAVLAGALFGGPFFLQLWADSSQAAICGLALMLPSIIVGFDAVRERRFADVVLLGILFGGLLSLYPLLVPQLIGGGALVLLVAAVIAWRRGDPLGRLAASCAWRAVAVIVIAAAITPIAFGRDLRYWKAILQGAINYSGLPQYHLPVTVLPGWLLQTRQFYFLFDIGVGGVKEFAFAVILPLLFIAMIVFALHRNRRALALVAFIAVCAVLAEYVEVSNHCEYCVQRNLLPVGPILALLTAAGVGALLAARSRLGRLAGVIMAVLVVLGVAYQTREEHRLVNDTAYLLDSANRVALSHLPKDHGYVEVEGYEADLRSPGELPLVNDLVNEHTDEHASIPLAAGDYSSDAYIAAPSAPGSWYHPDYKYVLTRFPGIATDRRTIVSYAGVALQQRTHALDVTPVAGLGAPQTRLDPEGDAWVQGGLLAEPLEFYVNGGRGDAPVWVRLELAIEQAVGIPHQRGVTSRETKTKTHLTICIRARGAAPVRTAKVNMSFTPLGGPVPATTYTLPAPAEGVELLGMFAQTHRCVP
jgi:hypothetical protein